MTITYYNDINVFFHMKNHYKMLKHVKSVVDSSVPQSFLKSPLAMSLGEKRIKGVKNEQLRKIYNNPLLYLPKRGGHIIKHNCLNTEVKSEGSLHAESLPSRPVTRRNPNITPKEALKKRSFSLGSVGHNDKMGQNKQKKRSSVSSNRNNSENIEMSLDLKQENSTKDEEKSPLCSKRSECSKGSKSIGREESNSENNRSFLKSSSSDQDYLLFLLRITEDIIVNDFYTNNDIKRIFKFHIEANKERLDLKKMHFHVSNLCRELNIACEEYDTYKIDTSEFEKPIKHSPKTRTYYLNNDIIKNCHECSVIRSSSLYKFHPPFGDVFNEENLENRDHEFNSSITPSLLNLLEKLSLGRVTECTEPAASTSTLNSPKVQGFEGVANNIFESNDNDGKVCKKIEILDFDSFVKELDAREMDGKSVTEDTHEKIDEIKSFHQEIPLESPPLQVFTTLSEENHLQHQALKNKENTYLNYNSNIENDIRSPLKEHSLENNDNFPVLSKYPDDQSLLNAETSEKAVDECQSSLHFSEHSDNQSPKNHNSNKSILDNPDNMPKKLNSQDLTSENVNKNTPQTPNIYQINTDNSNLSLIEKPQTNEIKIKPFSVTDQNDQCIIENNSNKSDTSKNLHETENNHEQPTIKVILQGSVNENDYVMIKGPVYVLKALLETDPKLVVFTTENEPEKSRRNSVQSDHSRRTFTVETDQAVENDPDDHETHFEATLHSLEQDISIDNILKINRKGYSQFSDSKLLNSDYDLTPQKDGSDNKYHHLLVDAATSVSNVNITENLLLNDKYATDNGENEDRFIFKGDYAQNVESSIENVDSYVRFEPKINETSYINHRRKVNSSVSMPRLKIHGDLGESNGKASVRSLGHRKETLCCDDVSSMSEMNAMGDVNSTESLGHVDVTSQDSSVRSEGETFQNYNNA